MASLLNLPIFGSLVCNQSSERFLCSKSPIESKRFKCLFYQRCSMAQFSVSELLAL